MVQIVKQTWQQRYDMYMKSTKEELARMLAERDRITNPEACTDGIYINGIGKAHPHIPDKASNSSSSFDEYTDDNGCRHESYSYTYDEFIADDNPTGITFIG